MTEQLNIEQKSSPLPAVQKSLIGKSFGAAAAEYDRLAGLQKEVGLELLSMAPPASAASALDIGCGTGWLTRHLKEHVQPAQLTGIDLAAGMVAYAQKTVAKEVAEWLQADMEALPIATSSQDLVYSNMAMQWLADPLDWFLEAARVLRPGGRLLCTTLLPGTLLELGSAWQEADAAFPHAGRKQHINSFPALDVLKSSLKESGFRAEVRVEPWVRYYPEVRPLLRELKGIGAHNMNESRPTALTGKAHLKAMLAAYEQFRKERGVPATYQVAFISAHI